MPSDGLVSRRAVSKHLVNGPRRGHPLRLGRVGEADLAAAAIA